jgi:hypothetical protein
LLLLLLLLLLFLVVVVVMVVMVVMVGYIHVLHNAGVVHTHAAPLPCMLSDMQHSCLPTS